MDANLSMHPHLPMHFHFLPDFLLLSFSWLLTLHCPFNFPSSLSKVSVKSFLTSTIFLPAICQASLKSPALMCTAVTPRSECNINDICRGKLFLRAVLSVSNCHQVKMTLLKNIPSLDGVKGTWETHITQVIKDLAMTTWSEALESQTDLKKILPLCNCCL